MKRTLIQAIQEELLIPNEITMSTLCELIEINPGIMSKLKAGTVTAPLYLFDRLGKVSHFSTNYWLKIYQEEMKHRVKELYDDSDYPKYFDENGKYLGKRKRKYTTIQTWPSFTNK